MSMSAGLQQGLTYLLSDRYKMILIEATAAHSLRCYKDNLLPDETRLNQINPDETALLAAVIITYQNSL